MGSCKLHVQRLVDTLFPWRWRVLAKVAGHRRDQSEGKASPKRRPQVKKKFSEKWNHHPDDLLNFLVKLKPFPLLDLSVMNACKSSVLFKLS